MAPRRLPKRLGTNAIVSSYLRAVKPTNFFKELLPNDYRTTRWRFVVKGISFLNERAILQLENARYPEKEFTAFAHSVKLEVPGPPNQYFVAETPTAPSRSNEEEEYEDVEPTEDGAVGSDQEMGTNDNEEENDDENTNGETTDGDWKWSKFFETITNDARGAIAKSDPILKKGFHTQLKHWTPVDFFHYFMPWDYFEVHLIPATNKSLLENTKKETNVSEIKTYFGIWFLMSLHPQYSMLEFFTSESIDGKKKRRRDDFWDPPKCGKYMSRNRFKDITSCLRLNNNTPPTYRDRSWELRELIKGFNDHMEIMFDPSWITCVDESMVSFLNEYCPNWVCIKRKPHPFGNEYHTIACCLSKIIFRIEMVETEKDRPKEGEYSTPEFENEMAKTAALCCRMTRTIWGTSRVCLLDSGFGYMTTLPELEKNGVFGTTVFKKKGVGWPKGSDAKNIVRHMHGKDVGYQVVRKAENEKYPTTNLWIAAMADSKHTSIMANTWSTTIPKDKRKRRVGGELITIDYSEYMYWYYFGRHAVDDNNNNRQGRLSFEEVFTPDRWEGRHLGFIVALTQVNSLLAYNFFNRSLNKSPFVSKSEFTRSIARDLIFNQDIELETAQYERPSTRGIRVLASGAIFNSKNDAINDPGHRLCRLAPYHGQWSGTEFPKLQSSYPKSKCKGKGCKQRCRTFCFCSYSLMLCAQCHGKHLEQVSAVNKQN